MSNSAVLEKNCGMEKGHLAVEHSRCLSPSIEENPRSNLAAGPNLAHLSM
jgi:hypothetical protein